MELVYGEIQMYKLFSYATFFCGSRMFFELHHKHTIYMRQVVLFPEKAEIGGAFFGWEFLYFEAEARAAFIDCWNGFAGNECGGARRKAQYNADKGVAFFGGQRPDVGLEVLQQA